MLRWRPTLPSGVPHVLDRDDTYKGYRIPRNTLVIANAWAVHHNAEDLESPSTFNPDRFMENDFGVKHHADHDEQPAERKKTYAFGAGRRICPGDRFAENGILLPMANLLWTFDIIPKEKLDTSVERGFLAGLAITPKDFRLDFIPRSDERKRGLMRDYVVSEKLLSQFG